MILQKMSFFFFFILLSSFVPFKCQPWLSLSCGYFWYFNLYLVRQSNLSSSFPFYELFPCEEYRFSAQIFLKQQTSYERNRKESSFIESVLSFGEYLYNKKMRISSISFEVIFRTCCQATAKNGGQFYFYLLSPFFCNMVLF